MCCVPTVLHVLLRSRNPHSTFSDVQNDSIPSNVVGDRVRQYRKALVWSIEQLAERCAAIGATSLTVPALYVIESGRREKETNRRRRMITVDEWLDLSKALGVAPLALLLPYERNADYLITSEISGTAEAAYRWIIGRWPDLRPVRESSLTDEEKHRYATNRPAWMTEAVELTAAEAGQHFDRAVQVAHFVAHAAWETGLTRGEGAAFVGLLKDLVANILTTAEQDPNYFDKVKDVDSEDLDGKGNTRE
ncbi:MAG: hypothetical protein JWQ81_6059 [Amycolatopsis sp.]|nr:hypothetical protein [Amycolatopsis sp.]